MKLEHLRGCDVLQQSDGVMTWEITVDVVMLLGAAPANMSSGSWNASSLISAHSSPFLSSSRLAAF